MSNRKRFPPPAFLCLPFIKDTPDGRKFWNVTPTGDYAADWETGEDYALLYLELVEASGGAVPSLPWLVAEMPRDITGIENGFLSIFARAARSFWVQSLQSSVIRQRLISKQRAEEARRRDLEERSARARNAANSRWARRAA